MDLQAAIKTVLPHAAKGSAAQSLPILGGVFITRDAVYATDRYTLAKAELTTPLDALSDVRGFLLESKTAAKGLSDVTRAVTTGSYSLAVDLKFADGSTMPYQSEDREYPDVEKLFTRWQAGRASENGFRVDASFLERFAPKHFPKDAVKMPEMRLEHDEVTNITRVTYTTLHDFVGLLVNRKKN
jgi:hypothetical protein